MLKRALDLSLSLAALLLLSPVLLACALAVGLTSPGGVFFRQSRVGRGGRPFRMFKFRSMVAGADAQGPYFTQPGDARITKVGAFIRKTSLDELPQLLNVLLGDMSLVGPRPDVPAQEPLYAPEEWRQRHSVRPGVTGLAQATLRSQATPEARKQLDLRYTREQSLILDLKILYWTLVQVIRKGSH